MINKNYTNQIRTCERIKFDQALYILTMYEKKIRKNRQILSKKSRNQEKGVDADEQLDDITYAWKNKWKMDLTKPVLNCVTSVHPRILVDYSNHQNQKLQRFYFTLGKFIRRMRAQHEDQTNYKFVLNSYDKTTMIGDHNVQTSNKNQQIYGQQQQKTQRQKLKLLNCAKASVNSILNVTYNMSRKCIKHFEENFEYIINQDIADVDTEGLEWQVIRPLRFVREITRRALFSSDGNEQMQNQDKQANQTLNPQSQQACQLSTFVHNTMKLMQRIKQSQHGSTLITIQPQIKQLTYIIHPLLAAVYATFKKENLQKQKDFDWKQVPVETKVFMENVRNSYNFSKIVLINLDGYESEFNLELARNFKKHLMYISFPKEEAILTDLQKVYSKRLFKKLMFRYTQALFQSYPSQNLSQDMKHMAKLQQLNFNPQNYHQFTQQMYYSNPQRAREDFNQNMFIFPIRYKGLKQNFPQLFQQTEKQDIETYQSYFIRFVMKDFMINQIREFNPSYVMISYSGRITMDDGHFVGLLQELTKVANYKLLFYPNLTTAFCSQEMMQVDDVEGNQCDYDNAVNDKKIEGLLRGCKGREDGGGRDSQRMEVEEEEEEELQQQCKESTSVQLFNKVARFLKVSSGTYNLTRTSQQDHLISKFKNQFILSYTDELMTTLGKEYNTIDRIRFKDKDLTIIPKLFEENLNAIKKSFTKTVPQFYTDLYKVLEGLLFKSNKQSTTEKLITSYRVKPSIYQSDIQQLWQQLSKSSSIQISSYQRDNAYMTEQSSQKNGKKDLMQQIQQMKVKKNMRQFLLLKQLHFIQISSEKYQQKVSIYIKKNPQTKQFTSISQQSQQTQGLYDVTFLRRDKLPLKIFQSTKLLYKSDQQLRQTNSIPIMIMNSLSDEKPPYFENYIAELDVSQELNKERKNIEEKKALATPIVLKEDESTVEGLRSFVVRSDWNFHQTKDYLILFWPTQFDFLQAIIYKMLNKNYSPSISHSIYISNKSTQKHIFRKVPNLLTTLSPVLPRIGCSCYQFQSRLFIFGGFYAKEKNYLNFQHDITMVDLLSYRESMGEKIQVENLKGVLYSDESFRQQVSSKNSYNSFIRPRMEFELFDKSQLAEWYQQPQQTKQVILFGGYGQNFLRPFSMLTYYYYQIDFSYQTRNISSIHKKIIYDKTVPINVREMTKNLGVIKTNKKNPNTNLLENNKITEPGSYLQFRNSFKIDKSPDNTEDFKYKYRYMFAEDQFKNFKTEIKKVQEQRTEEFDSSTIAVEKMEGNNHLISLEKDGKKCVICLHLEIPHQKAKKLGCSRQVKLTHESIIYIDFWNSMICAIIKHDFYTKGKSVLVEYNIKSLQNLSFNHDQIPHIALTWMKEFDLNLSLHILIACNKNTIAILHGQKLLNSEKVKEFIVKKKKNKTEALAYEIVERSNIQANIAGAEYCYSVFYKQRNKILCLEYLSDRRSSTIVQMAHEIELNSANDIYTWQPPAEKGQKGQSMGNSQLMGNRQFSGVTQYRVVYGQSQMSIPLHKLEIKEYFKVQRQQGEMLPKGKRPTQRVIQVQYNKRTYYLELGSLGAGQKGGVEVLEMVPAERLNIEKENIEKGTILSKNIEKYYEII